MFAFPQSRFQKMDLAFPVFVAPMVGLSHVAFRELVRSYVPVGVGNLLFTEMLSTRRIPNERLDTTEQLLTSPADAGRFIPQLLGNEEKYIAPSVLKLLSLDPWGFDINMGCPTSHTLKHNWGVRLMGDQDYAAEVVRITKRHSPKPVSVKLRGGAGEVEDADFLCRFTDALEKAGADWITIHPRPRAQGHRGEANWALVTEVRKRRSIPVVANGDIQTAADVLRVLREYEADGAMVARAATARPWILWQVLEDLGCVETPLGYEGQRAPRTPEEEGREFGVAALRFIALLKRSFSAEDFICERFQFWAATASRWLPFGHSFWKTSTKAKTVAQLESAMGEFVERSPQEMYGRVKFF